MKPTTAPAAGAVDGRLDDARVSRGRAQRVLRDRLHVRARVRTVASFGRRRRTRRSRLVNSSSGSRRRRCRRCRRCRPAGRRPGRKSLCWSLNSAIWLRRLCTIVTRLLCLASLDAFVNCGITIAARMPRMITTIRISISVKPLRFVTSHWNAPVALTVLFGPVAPGPPRASDVSGRRRRRDDIAPVKTHSVIAGGDSARRGPSGRRIGKHDRAPRCGGRRTRCDGARLSPRPSHRTSRPRCSASPYGSSGRRTPVS